MLRLGAGTVNVSGARTKKRIVLQTAAWLVGDRCEVTRSPAGPLSLQPGECAS